MGLTGRYLKYKRQYLYYVVSGDLNVGLVKDSWFGYRITDELVWFLKSNGGEKECSKEEVPEVLRNYVDSEFFEIDLGKIMSNMSNMSNKSLLF